MASAAPELELRDYLSVLRRRRATVALATLVVVGLTLVVSLLRSPVYEAEAELLLQPAQAELLLDPALNVRSDPNRAIQTEIRMIRNEPVRELVRQRLGEAPSVSVRPVDGTDIVVVAAEDGDPERAAEVANAYAESYLEYRRTQASEEAAAATQEIQPTIDDLQAQIDDLQAQIDAASPEDRSAAQERLGPQRDALIQQRALLAQRLGQVELRAGLGNGGARLAAPAETPDSPVRPKPLRSGVIALGAGLVLGIGLAFLLDYLDDSVKGKEDIERVAPGANVLGLIPRVDNLEEQPLVTLSERSSEAAEAYRTLRTSIRFLGLDRALGSLQVTSPDAYDGKTTTVANLGVVLRQAGFRVAVVGADLRRPRIHKLFGLTNDVGFTSVLLGQVSLADALQEVPGLPQLVVLGSGPLPPNPSELLSSRQAAEILASLRSSGYFVLLDAPPVIPVTDALVISRQVDATLLVCSTATSRRDVGRAFELFDQVGAPLAGVVLNGVSGQAGYGYYGGYYAPPGASRPDAPDGMQPARSRTAPR